MSRYSGTQGRGASRQLRAQRRTEAETRQASERAWYEQRCREIEDEYANARPLTDEEFVQLLSAVLGVDAGRRVFVDVVLRGRDPFKPYAADMHQVRAITPTTTDSRS